MAFLNSAPIVIFGMLLVIASGHPVEKRSLQICTYSPQPTSDCGHARIALLRIAYSMFDSNNNCQATLSEVKEAVRARGAHINDAKVEEFFRSADTDGTPGLSLKEFDTVLKDLMPTTPPQDFARSDLDNSGNINLDEFGKALKYAGNPTGRGVDHFFNNVVDSNRDGNGSYSEYVRGLENGKTSC